MASRPKHCEQNLHWKLLAAWTIFLNFFSTFLSLSTSAIFYCIVTFWSDRLLFVSSSCWFLFVSSSDSADYPSGVSSYCFFRAASSDS